MSDPIVWPSAPPTAPPTEPPPISPPTAPSTELPPPPPDEQRRPVAAVGTRVGELALEVVLIACTFGFGWVGWWIISWADGRTPAKVVLHLHVVRADDATLASFGRMAIREGVGKGIAGVAAIAGVYFHQIWLVAIPALYLIAGGALAYTDVRRRTLWDRLAGTVVLDGDAANVVFPTAPVEVGTSLE